MATYEPTTDAAGRHNYVAGQETVVPQQQHLHHHNGNTYNEANGGPSNYGSHHHQSTVSHVRPSDHFRTANPGPLGLLSFAGTTFVLGFYMCGIGLPNADPFSRVGPDHAIFGLAVFFGGLAQFVAGLMEFRVGNTFGTTLHCSYGAFFLAYAMFLIPSLGIRAAYGSDVRAYTVALGIFFIMWFIVTLIFFFGALRTNAVMLALLGFLTLAFFFLAIAQFIRTRHATAATRVNRAGGAFAILSALAAFYAGSAGIYTGDTTSLRLPLFEFGGRKGASSKHPVKNETVV